MRYRLQTLIVKVIALSLLLNSCGDTKTYDEAITYHPAAINDNYEIGIAVFHPETSGHTELTYSLEIQSDTPKQVYFIFTNSNTGIDTPTPSIISENVNYAEGFFSETPLYSSAYEEPAPQFPYAQRGIPEITEFNRNSLYALKDSYDAGYDIRRSTVPAPRISYTVGTTDSFNVFTNENIAATVRNIKTNNGRTLYIWVADADWKDNGNGDSKVTPDMVEIMADKFLGTGENGNIYSHVTGIFGEEWGEIDDSRFINMTDEIHILLYNIDGSACDPNTGGILGYFWSRDNYTSGVFSNSNEKIMFYMNACLYASANGAWSQDDFWPRQMFSTLAHELQHMIHFYQKSVINYVDSGRIRQSDTWIDEMCSLMAEDFVADTLGIEGPRGVDPGDGDYDYSAGSSGNLSGRLPRFNRYNYISLTSWRGEFEDYSVSYAFGAYLARNYGGAELFREIVQNSRTNYLAITEAITSTDEKVNEISLAKLMRDWGAAVVLSNITEDLPDTGRYVYNTGGAFDSMINGNEYSLGSINLYNYRFSGLDGPLFLDDLESRPQLLRGSNLYYNAGMLENGEHTWTILMRDGVYLTVIARDDNE